jgi:hypothetical protein
MTDPSTPSAETIEELTRLEAAAAPGPWIATNPDDSSCMNIYCVTTGREPDDEAGLEEPGVICATLLQTPARVGSPYTPDDDTQNRWYENAMFIAAARNALPALLSDRARMAEQLARLPQTADGVPIVPGMTIWVRWADAGVKSYVVTRIGDGKSAYPVAWDEDERDCASHVSRRELDIVFSTAAAAGKVEPCEA